uniref:Uncharacterized protein n=1 Tax=Picea sitchensis TaxID=3332 RepID=D5ABY1_PICSI|nr:unknown [Picea sitchensis]
MISCYYSGVGKINRKDLVFRSSSNDPQFCGAAVWVGKPNGEILILFLRRAEGVTEVVFSFI